MLQLGPETADGQRTSCRLH